MKHQEYKICANCVMNTTDSKIQFDEKGYCDHCNNFYKKILPNWHPDETGARELDKIVSDIKRHGKGKKYDCLIGLSGGVDSSYLVYLAKKKLGLRPLVFCVDTGWNLDIANKNVERLIQELNLDVYTEVVDWEEMKDLQLAFIKSQVPHQDIPQDHAIFAALYNFAAKNGFKYVLTGANFSTECIREPIEWAYVNDLTQIKDIHKKFGTRPLEKFPMCGMFRYRLYYRYVKGMTIVQPLNLIPYVKEDAVKELNERFGWEKYPNKHFENVFTRFYEGYWLPRKFGYDKRRAHLSSLIVTGQLTREEALEILKEPPYPVEEAMQDMDFIARKLGITKAEFEKLMNAENKTFKDYNSSLTLINAAIKLAQLIGFEKRNLR
ncbi:MAG: N-acetyl sugar amidotransferase [Epulopiscium sp.]|nr:N-acetyl sugar amidotransferase [Candidatus Epulonipiscium sp.]